MQLRSTSIAWGAISRWLHWGFAVALVGMVSLGLWMVKLPVGVRKVKIYSLHKSVGLTLLVLVALRLLWRLGEQRPEMPAMPPWQARAARSVHVALYVLMFLIPLSGWLFNSAAGFPLQWFHLVNLPALTPADPALKPVAHALHVGFGWTLVALVAAHSAAALKHHFLDRDRTLCLMVPWLRSREAQDPRGDVP